MQWPDFASRLGAALHRLATEPSMDATLVICQSTRPLAYVQFLVNDGGVYAEVSSARQHLPKEQRLTPESLDLLKNSGWSKPGVGSGVGNWTTEIHPADPAECANVADKCVVALRDVWRVPDPNTLVYRAFHSETSEDLTVDELGLAREPNQ